MKLSNTFLDISGKQELQSLTDILGLNVEICLSGLWAPLVKAFSSSSMNALHNITFLLCQGVFFCVCLSMNH